jgi:hypothetical protein
VESADVNSEKREFVDVPDVDVPDVDVPDAAVLASPKIASAIWSC